MSVKGNQSALNRTRMALVINLVSHIIYLFTLPVWYFISMFAVMMFDAPGSEDQWLPVFIYTVITCYPYVVLGAITIAWILYARGLSRQTYVVNAIPTVMILVSLGLALIFGK